MNNGNGSEKAKMPNIRHMAASTATGKTIERPASFTSLKSLEGLPRKMACRSFMKLANVSVLTNRAHDSHIIHR